MDKDLMNDAFDSFWATGYTKKKVTNTNKRFLSDQAIYQEPTYRPEKRIQYQSPQPRQIVPNYRPQVNQSMPQVQRLSQQPRSNVRTNKFIGSLIKGAISGVSDAASRGSKYAKYHTAPASEKLKREEKALKTRLSEQRASRKLETIREADTKLSQAKTRERVYKIKAKSKQVASTITNIKKRFW